jgi:CRP-like cAMP-binding protein
MNDELNFLKKSDIFKGLPDSLLDRIFQAGTVHDFGPGEYVFRENEQRFELYVIRRGVVEILKKDQAADRETVVAYLCPGECFGEMAMLTGRPRSAAARVPEEAEILEIPAETYEYLTSNNIFLRRLCEILALRLEQTDIKVAGEQHRKELQGDLRYFDLGTVMQTLINSGQSGVMVIETPQRHQADLVFAEGRILQARFRRLEGEQAFYQIFQEDLEGKFMFQGQDIDPRSIAAPIAMGPMNLLLEAMRMKDETPVFLRKIDNMDRAFNPTRKMLVWEDKATLEPAIAIWERITAGAPLRQILQELPCCTYQTLVIVHRMLEGDLIR